MNDRDSAYSQGDDFARRMAAMSDTYGIDAELTNGVVHDAVGWLRDVLKQAKDAKVEMRKAVECPHCTKRFTLELMDVEKVAKSTAAIAKTTDIVVRLTAFTQGKEDSRPGGTSKGTDWLQCLEPDQLAIVQGWIREKMAVQG